MSTCNWLDLQTLGSQPMIMPKNLPHHCAGWAIKAKEKSFTLLISAKLWAGTLRIMFFKHFHVGGGDMGGHMREHIIYLIYK